MISLTKDGNTFGHRLHTRSGEVAPGFMCCKFDEILDGEPQPMWVAILLAGDIQVRLTLLRPTFPVMAFEAPGALGTEQPRNINRRSNFPSGWEYAEVEGRAVSIQRLIGYDCQSASIPFLGQSNINLAYPYSEQPAVYESAGSVAARCLAAASLIRPLPFDPQSEFNGIGVEVETPEIFRVTLRDSKVAMVSPGESRPRRVELHGVEVKGPAIRYVQMDANLNEICGLGLTRIEGVAEFDMPASFRLRRSDDGEIRLLTDQAVALNKLWTKGGGHFEVRTLNDQWQDVTADCSKDYVPDKVIMLWQERNQRTLVEFRIRI
jgi:hypothetical protein